jgi:hypothetical protein
VTTSNVTNPNLKDRGGFICPEYPLNNLNNVVSVPEIIYICGVVFNLFVHWRYQVLVPISFMFRFGAFPALSVMAETVCFKVTADVLDGRMPKVAVIFNTSFTSW